MVWIAMPDGKAAMRPVQTAGWIGADWVVTGGLEPGAAVIVDNIIKLRPGVTVKPQAPGDGPAAEPRAPAQSAPPAKKSG
jgi:membrane fusion protein, multidrug efflux system